MSESGNCDACDRTDCPAQKRMEAESPQEFIERRQLESRLCGIGRKVLVLSGKGGVGKSTVAVNLAVLGVVENMSGCLCPNCGQVIDVFKKGGGEKMAADMGVPFLGRVPLDPAVVESGDAGRPCVFHEAGTPAAKAFSLVAGTLRARLEKDR